MARKADSNILDPQVTSKKGEEHTGSSPFLSKHSVVLITGMSGAGKSVGLKTLEDLGFEAIDNIPLSLVENLVKSSHSRNMPLAIGLDVRNREFSITYFKRLVTRLRRREDLYLKVLFLDCENDTLLHRYTETRRKHPMSTSSSVVEGIQNERVLMEEIRDYADVLLDTTHFSTLDFKQWLIGYFSLKSSGNLSIALTSFSFKRGLPKEADMVFDVRFLKNPYYVAALRPLTGQQPEVREFIINDPNFSPFFTKLSDLILSLIPCYQQEGKSYLTIAIGCTGGQHRSVCVVEQLKEILYRSGINITVRHPCILTT